MNPAVTFDLDGTLATYERPWPEVMGDVFGAKAPEGTVETFGRTLQDGLANLRADSIERAAATTVREHGLEADPATIAQDVRNAEVAATVAVPGARQLVEWVGDRRPVGLLTNGDDALQRRKAADLGILEEMDAVIVSCDVGVSKPDSEIFEIAAERLDVESGLHIGDDRAEDVDGALAAGWEAIHLDGQTSPDAAVASINDVSRLVDLLAADE